MNLRQRLLRSMRAWAVAGAVLCSGSVARAITHTWVGTSNSMNVAGNWSGGLPVSSTANLTLVFNSPFFSTFATQDIANPLVLESLQVEANYFLNGNTIQFSNLGSAPTLQLNSNTLINPTIQAPLQFNAATTISGSGAGFKQVDLSGTLSGGNVTFDATTATTQYFIQGATANTLSGSQFVKGLSTVFLGKPAGVAALGGSVTVDGGSARIVTNAVNQFAAGTDLTLINGGTFEMNGVSQAVDDFVVESGGFVAMTGAETLTINGAISSSAGVGAVGYGFSGTTVDFAGQVKTIPVTSTGVGDKLLFRDRIINGSIIKTGVGKLEVANGNNSFTGTNVVSAGTLMGSPQSVGTVNNNATVEFNGFGTLAANQITGSGQVVISSVGVTFAGAQNYAGGTILNGSAQGDTSTLLGTFTATTGGSMDFQQNVNGTWTGTLSGPASLAKFGTATLSLGGNNPYSNGTFVGQGTLNITTNTAIGSGPLTVGASIEATGTRTLSNTFNPLQATFVGSGNLNFTDTADKFGMINTTHNSTGTTDVAGKWTNGGATITVNAGVLAIGNPGVLNGFTTTGPVVVNGGTLTVRSLNFITLPDVTLAGGTLNAPNGYAIPLGAVLTGQGGVTGRVASANGSTIIASGNMTIGDGAHLAGVNLDGELYTGNNAVTLNDANQAVLGSLTQLGFAIPGTLNAPNGLVVNFGRNIAGWGQVNSTNALAQAVIMNGHAQGDSLTNYLDFTGWVKGVGTFDNVAFSGTFSPGLSPALVEVGNVLLTATSVLEMEIGGANRGGQYDAIDVSGTLKLGGTLKLSLLNSFAPAAGSEWQLFDGTLAGAFSDFDLPSLGAGLSWDLSGLYSEGVAAVVAGLAGDFDADGDVDGGDFMAWQRGLSPTPGSAGDLINWRANFDVSVAAAGTVPEPAGCSLLVTAAVAGAMARRRNRLGR
jgi:autotransporter-associated beta strand protein